jgi:hypothetical protein
MGKRNLCYVIYLPFAFNSPFLLIVLLHARAVTKKG